MSGILASQTFGTGGGGPGTNILLKGNQANVNLHTLLLANGWNGIAVKTYSIIIDPTTYIYSNSTGTPALDTGIGFPTGMGLYIINNGVIIGKGGDGGSSSDSSGNGLAGNAGGTALHVQFLMTLINKGAILGGGGGGGAGAGRQAISGLPYWAGIGGGGGGGVGGSNGGIRAQGGSLIISGLGGPGIYSNLERITSGIGGTGGGYGQQGQGGQSVFSVLENTTFNGGAGGAGGAAIIGNSNITYIVPSPNTGSVYGLVS